MQESWQSRVNQNSGWEDRDIVACDNGNFHDSVNDHDVNDCDCNSYGSSQWQWMHDPIVVAYAFGPKKLRSMGLVMAEACRVPVIHEEIAELAAHDRRLEELTDDASGTSRSEVPGRKATLTKAALRDLDTAGAHPSSTIITLGNANDTDLKHIVRYFRSSCSSAASRSETTASTPTTVGTGHSSKFSTTRFPVRISFVPVDPDFPLDEQHGGYFDLILHKLTEDILSCSLNDRNKENAVRRIRSLKQYKEKINPSCCLVDDPSNVETLMNRACIAHVLRQCLGSLKSTSGTRVRAPKYLVVNEPATKHQIQDRLSEAKLCCPLIVKPLMAAGTKESHFMTIVLQSAALTRIPPGYIIQEYVNHDATLFKVYVLGEEVFVYKRTSLPNLPATDVLESSLEYVEFDSQRPYPGLQDFGIFVQETDCKCLSREISAEHSFPSPIRPPISASEVRPLVEGLRKAFGLQLFGFDILVSQKEGEMLVVDVNYFPSYKEVPNFPSLLAHYLSQRVLNQRKFQK